MILSIYSLVALALALAYTAVQGAYAYAWRRLPAWQLPEGYVPCTAVTVVVPARNEAAHIGACLTAILNGRYPAHLLEVLVVDDFSDDNTAELVSTVQAAHPDRVRLICLSDRPDTTSGGKKQALALAIREARGSLIVTTDADCLAPPDWLRHLVSLQETTRAAAVVAPVAVFHDRNLLQHFQALDMAGMMGITGAGIGLGWHHMGNGANLCYTRAAFFAVDGFAGSEAWASGDDLFLIQKIARHYPVVFLKNNAATVYTEAPAGWGAFFQQRLRWGSKNRALPEAGLKAALAIVLLLCSAILLNALGALFFPELAWVLVVQVTVKALADFMLLRTMCAFFQRPGMLRWFWPSFLLHVLYITCAGITSLAAGRYTWKGRRLH
jgi:cellulose synthase/poly-beta-1,6-N-acetylglucosamine synthase-like glycosyltransferase